MGKFGHIFIYLNSGLCVSLSESLTEDPFGDFSLLIQDSHVGAIYLGAGSQVGRLDGIRLPRLLGDGGCLVYLDTGSRVGHLDGVGFSTIGHSEMVSSNDSESRDLSERFTQIHGYLDIIWLITL